MDQLYIPKPDADFAMRKKTEERIVGALAARLHAIVAQAQTCFQGITGREWMRFIEKAGKEASNSLALQLARCSNLRHMYLAAENDTANVGRSLVENKWRLETL